MIVRANIVSPPMVESPPNDNFQPKRDSRRDTLGIFRQTVSDRFGPMEKYLRVGEILDVGCVNSRPHRQDTTERVSEKMDLLFQRIIEINPHAVGLDIDQDGVEALRERGLHVYCANAEDVKLNHKFDTIIAGELIEHLENPGRFLRNMRAHLRERGVLILSTPNPFAEIRTWKIWRYAHPKVHEDHTCWFDPMTLCQLLRRTGYEPFEGYWIQPADTKSRAWRRLLRPYFSYSFMVIARRAD